MLQWLSLGIEIISHFYYLFTFLCCHQFLQLYNILVIILLTCKTYAEREKKYCSQLRGLYLTKPSRNELTRSHQNSVCVSSLSRCFVGLEPEWKTGNDRQAWGQEELSSTWSCYGGRGHAGSGSLSCWRLEVWLLIGDSQWGQSRWPLGVCLRFYNPMR